MTTATTNLEQAGQTAEEVAKTTQESARIMMDYAVKMQEENTKLAQRAAEAWIEGFHQQAMLSQNMMHELFDKAEEQTNAFEKLFGPWGSVMMGMPYAPFVLIQESLRMTRTPTGSDGSQQQ